MPLYISEFEWMSRVFTPAGINFFAVAPIALTPSLNDQTIGIGGTSSVSAVWQTATAFVRVHNDSTSPCSVVFGSSPTATTANMRLAENSTEYFGVVSGQRLAVIQNT